MSGNAIEGDKLSPITTDRAKIERAERLKNYAKFLHTFILADFRNDSIRLKVVTSNLNLFFEKKIRTSKGAARDLEGVKFPKTKVGFSRDERRFCQNVRLIEIV